MNSYRRGPRQSPNAREGGLDCGLRDSVGVERPSTSNKLWSFEDPHEVLESARHQYLPDSPEPSKTPLTREERLRRFRAVRASLADALPLAPVGGGPFEMGRLFVPAGRLADGLHHCARIHILAAYAVQGVRALKNTQVSAAVHEAGHGVVGQREGAAPTEVRIWREGGEWTGGTRFSFSLPSDQTTSPEEDLRKARVTLAGMLAELLFDPDYCLGTSVDEISVTCVLVYSAAAKMRRDPDAVFWELARSTAKTLLKNEKTVRAIAEVLMREGVIRSKELAKLLDEVEACHAR